MLFGLNPIPEIFFAPQEVSKPSYKIISLQAKLHTR